MSENKVQFGLKNVYYAPLTEGTTNTWATPVALPGAVNLALAKQGEATDFYADNVTYFKTVTNNGYSGTLEMARIDDNMLKTIFGMSLETTSNILFEKSGVQPVPFALMFEIDGDADKEKFCFYRCIAERPEINAQTSAASVEPQTQTINISCLPLVTGSDTQKGLIKARTTATTPTATKNSWFTAVPVPAV